MHKLSILITFDPTTWKPTTFFYNAATTAETDKLREIVSQMLAGIAGDGEKC